MVCPRLSVDHLEAIEVDIEDGEPPAIARGAGDRLTEPIEEQLPVGKRLACRGTRGAPAWPGVSVMRRMRLAVPIPRYFPRRVR